MKLHSFNRRDFFRTCLSTATMVAANPSLLAQANMTVKLYTPALLVDEKQEPLTSKSFAYNQHYIFHYPFSTTPCFLINLNSPVPRPQNLKTRNNDAYQWPGGVGPDKTLVAFSAICAHKLSYVARTTSFISFRPEEISYVGIDQKTAKQSQLIYCCSERSVYDPARGAKVIGGPAPQPLTSIIIQHDTKTDYYYATATLGGELFNQFFEKFSYRLALENDNDDVRQYVAEAATVYTVERYSSHSVSC